MRALLFHSKKYQISITGLATRPASIAPEKIVENKQECKNCIVAFVCFEKSDKAEFVERLGLEIEKMMEEVGHRKLAVVPFAHLSSQLAPSSLALKLLDALCERLKNYELIRTHFGSDKALLLDVFGHPGNVRFREFK